MQFVLVSSALDNSSLEVTVDAPPPEKSLALDDSLENLQLEYSSSLGMQRVARTYRHIKHIIVCRVRRGRQQCIARR